MWNWVVILGAGGGILPRPCNSPQDCCSPAGRKAPGTGCSNPTLQPCIVCRKNKKQHPAGCCLWRRRWDSNPRDIAVKLISSFLVYIATDGIYRKKAEVVGRWFDRPTTKNVEKEVLFNVGTSQFEPVSKCRFFGKNERKTGIFGTLERCRREKQERTKKLNFPYCYGHLQKCVD